MPDLTTVADYIEWQIKRTLAGQTATLEEYREHLGDERRRTALESVAHLADPSTPMGDETVDEILNRIHTIATEALKEES